MHEDAYQHESRKTPRKQMTFPAWVESAHQELVQCEVLDMALAGARLVVPDAALPSEFTLLLDANARLKRRCKVVWRDGFTAGVEFV